MLQEIQNAIKLTNIMYIVNKFFMFLGQGVSYEGG